MNLKIIFILLIFVLLLSIIIIVFKNKGGESFSDVFIKTPYKPDERCKNYYEIQLSNLRREQNRILDGKQDVIRRLISNLDETKTELNNCNQNNANLDNKIGECNTRLIPYILSDQRKTPARITELFLMRSMNNLIISIVGNNFGQKDDWKINILNSSGIFTIQNQPLNNIIDKNYITVYGNESIEISIPDLIFGNPKSVQLELISSFDRNIKSNSMKRIF